MSFLDERSQKINELEKTTLVEHRNLQLHDAIARFAGLTNELQDNLDEYQDYAANHLRPVPDLRKVLLELQNSARIWQGVLASLPHDEAYDFVLEDANQSLQSLEQQAEEMLPAQTRFFAAQKKLEKEKQKQGDGYVLP